MRYGSLCSGIEAASVAWEPLGWEPQFFAEIEAFPSAVLAHRWPQVPNLGDMTKFKEWPDAALDVLVGGTPCQSFSVAGLRKGMADPRGNLALTFLAIADKYRPQWLVWENVPGVLSSNGGRDFGAFLGGLVQLGYGFSYRVLDAQYFGVAQRRRRVFVVGHLGDWRRAAAVLFERDSLQRNPPPSREQGKGFATDVAPSLVSSGRGVERCGETRGQDPVVAVAGTLTATYGEQSGQDMAGMAGGLQIVQPVADTLTSHWHNSNGATAGNNGGMINPVLAFAQNQRDEVRTIPVAGALASQPGMKQQTYLAEGLSVRRLMPVECERLQGFPDNHTLIPYRNKPAADGPRYKTIGNSMAVPVMQWIGERIQEAA